MNCAHCGNDLKRNHVVIHNKCYCDKSCHLNYVEKKDKEEEEFFARVRPVRRTK